MPAFAEQLLELPPPFNMVVLIMVIIFGSILVGELVGQVRKYASHQNELAFKRELVDRGLNVDEIERIVHARSGSSEEKDA